MRHNKVSIKHIITSCALAITLILGTLTPTAIAFAGSLMQGNRNVGEANYAASVIIGDNITNYSTFSSALSDWVAGSTLKLYSDVSTSDTITVPFGEHTLDLNGHELKAMSSGYSVVSVVSGANLTIIDSGEGGKITGGSVAENFGGGITVDGGTLILEGGTISNNSNTYGNIGNCGGGIHVKNGGSFYMVGGEISANTSYVGGAVCTDISDTTVSITGGVIKNNTTERFGSAIWAGRSVNSTLHIGGSAEIVGNISKWTSDKDGEGTINFGSGLLLSGDPTVKGDWKTSGTSAPNTHINLDNVGSGIQLIELEGALTNDTGTPKIVVSPIYRWNDLENGQSFVFTKNWSKYMGDADPSDFFASGNPDYGVQRNAQGEVEILKKQVATVTKGNSVTDYYDFTSAVKSWTAGSTLTIFDNVTTTATIEVPAGIHTLNLNGFNITRTGANGNDNSGLVITVNNGANLTVTGPGKISGGSGFHGGGIHVEGQSSSLVLDNCEIRGNTGHYGGGLYMKAGSITLKNGTVVKDNFATEGYGGPGIYAEGGGKLILEDCTFTQNRMNNGNQYAVFLCGNAYAEISGAPLIYDNIYNGEQKNLLFFQSENQKSKIIFKGALTEGAKIGVRQTNYFGAITEGWEEKMEGADFAEYIKSDNTGMIIAKNNDGELVIIDKNTSAFVISDGNTSYFKDFSSAISSWLNSTDGATLKLYKDVTYSNNIILSNGKVRVFDLNGKTYTRAATGDGTVFDVNGGARFTLTDTSEEQTGVVTRESGNMSGTVLFTRDTGSVINFNGGKLTGFTSRVIITWQGSTVNMTGGEISGNNLNNGDDYDGIVRTYSSTNDSGGTFNMSGGRIVNNTLGSGKTGGAVYVGNNGTFNISGDVEISGNTQNGKPLNVYLPAGKTMNVIGELTDNASVFVTLQNETGIITSGWQAAMGDVEKVKFFTADNSDCEMRIENGEVIMAYPYLMGVSSTDVTSSYDGLSHTITVNIPEGATVKYGTEEGSYTLTECPAFSDAGSYIVYYQVSKAKYSPVSGSATVKIDPISATVTITGHTLETDYDGTAHIVTGYDAASDTSLYDVTSSFDFYGTDSVELTNAGTSYMGLDANQFVNTNPNFDNVTFIVTDGYITVNTVDAVITTKPESSEPIYNKSDLELVLPGIVDGGVLYYALGREPKEVPVDTEFSTSIPTAKETGSYYVWYKVISDDNHNDLEPAYVRVILAKRDWVKISGVLYNKDGRTAVGGAVVTLMNGSRKIDYLITEEDGQYLFIVPEGVYSLVAENKDNTQTSMVTLFSDKTVDTVLSGGKTESHLKVDTNGNDSFVVAVNGLNEEAQAIRKAGNISDDKSVSVVMIVENKTKDNAKNAKAIGDAASDKKLTFFDTRIERTIDSVTTFLSKTRNVLEIAVPYPETDKRGVEVYTSDGNEVYTLRESRGKEEDTFYVDKENGVVYIYTKRFSTFALGYTPYYKVETNVSLGSFTGLATVMLENSNGSEVFRLENVSVGNISFDDVPKGQYTLTIVWEDGVENTLSFPITITDDKSELSNQTLTVAEISDQSTTYAQATFTDTEKMSASPLWLAAPGEVISSSLNHSPEKFFIPVKKLRMDSLLI